MSESKVYPVTSKAAENALVTAEQYKALHQQSIDDPETFWGEHAKSLKWMKPWKTIFNGEFTAPRWFDGGQLNLTENCLDRHLEERGDQPAIIWEGDNPADSMILSYQELHAQVCRFANALKDLGTRKGDRVCIYMPMIVETAVAMLACARIGAIHSVVFGGFSARALQDRIQNAECKILITADEGMRANKKIPLKTNADATLQACKSVKKMIVVRRTGGKINWNEKRDVWYHDIIQKAEAECKPEPMDSEDPLFILYTSGSTGKPKGVLHTTAGYLLYASLTHRYVFDYRDGDIYWCTADVGWITGHSYILYGPLANGATTLMFEGVPNHPSAARCWEIIDKHKVNIFYTAPTVIRALMREGNHFLKSSQRDSLKLLGSVGESINPEAWEWYYHLVGKGKCPIVDTWWQTETGGIMLSALPGATALKPGSANKPFFGIKPAILDEERKPVSANTPGKLVITQSWPGQFRTIFGNHQRYIEAYFSEFPGNFYSGDGAYCDEDGDYWISGRVDDVVNVSGHRIGTAEVESALALHPDIVEAAIIGIPDPVKGSSLYAFVTLKKDVEPSDKLKETLDALVEKEIGPIAKPEHIQFASDLPKTRSGKIMRRILRRIATNEIDKIGDISTLSNPQVIDSLLKSREGNR